MASDWDRAMPVFCEAIAYAVSWLKASKASPLNSRASAMAVSPMVCTSLTISMVRSTMAWYSSPRVPLIFSKSDLKVAKWASNPASYSSPRASSRSAMPEIRSSPSSRTYWD